MDQWELIKQSTADFRLNLKDSLLRTLGFYGIRNAAIQSLLVQCLTEAGYVYLALLYIHSSNLFYLLIAMSIIQTIITIFYSMFLHDFLYNLKSKILYREDSPNILYFGVIKIILGSPLSGVTDVMLWSEVSSLWDQKDGSTRNADIITSLKLSSFTVLLSAMFLSALDFSGLTMPMYYAYILLALGLLSEGYLIIMNFLDKINLSHGSFMLFMLEDFDIFAILLDHLFTNLLTADMRIELLLVILLLSLFDLLYTNVDLYETIYGNTVLNFRGFLGACAIIFSAIFISLPAIPNAYTSPFASWKLVFPELTWSRSLTIIFFSLLIAEALGYILIAYLFKDIFIEKFEYEDDLSEEFNLSTFWDNKMDVSLNTLSKNLTQKLRERCDKYEELERKNRELKNEIQRLDESLSTEYQRGFDDASKKIELEIKKMKDEFKMRIHISEEKSEAKILNLLFEVDYAPRDGKSKEEFFKKIKNELAKIYHPDLNEKANTNRIMQIINNHYENLTK